MSITQDQDTQSFSFFLNCQKAYYFLLYIHIVHSTIQLDEGSNSVILLQEITLNNTSEFGNQQIR